MNHQFQRRHTTIKMLATKTTLLILLMVCMNHLYAQVITPFSIRYQSTQKGGIRYISNTSVTCSGVACGAGRTEVLMDLHGLHHRIV